MADSGNLDTSNQYIKYKIIATEESYSIPNNTSTVRVRVIVWRTNVGYTTNGTGTCYVTCNGENKSAGITSSQKFTHDSNTEVFNQTFIVPHNADGTKTVSITSYISHERFSSNAQGFNFPLTPIPRASTVSSISGNTIGSNIIVNINRARDSFTHRVVLTFGNKSSTLPSATTSASFTPAMNWCEEVPNSTSGTATITLTTYNGNTQIGTSTKTFTLYVPASAKPGTITLTQSDDTGVKSTMGEYIQGKSKLHGVINVDASTCHGATITGYKAVVNGATYTPQTNSVSGTNYTSKPFTTGFLSTSGTNNCVITVTDSRGRTNTVTIQFTVIAYTPPKITTFTAERDTSTPTQVNYGIAWNIDQVMIGGVVKNTKSCTLKYKKQSDSSYTSVGITLNTFVPSQPLTGNVTSIDDSKTYNFVVELTDALSTTTAQIDIGTAFQLVNYGKNGNGMAIGGVYDTDIGGVLQIDGVTKVSGAIERNFASSFTTITPPKNVLSITGSTDGFKLDYEAPSSDYGITSLYTTDDMYAKLSLGNSITEGNQTTYKEAISIVNGSATVTGSLNGNATNVTQKKSANSISHTNYGTNNGYVPDMSFIAFWNGAYNGNNASNLKYCYKGLIRQNNTAFLNYGRKTYTFSTAWVNYDLSQGQNGATTGSGIIVNGNQIKINSTAINRVLVTASIEGFKTSAGTGDISFSVLVSYNSIRRNILYTSVRDAYWNNGGSITFPVTVANGTTIKIQGASGIANSSVEVLNGDLFVQDITQ